MSGIFLRQAVAVLLAPLLIFGTTPIQAGAQEAGTAGYSGQGIRLNNEQLEAIVAPIALYPDALVAQILGAASFPDQVAVASEWLQQHGTLTAQQLVSAVDAQQWEPSVKGLTQFPTVLQNLAKNLSWTSSLGEAYTTQGADVMSAVQILRAKAQAVGNLKSSSQITVVQQAPQTIVIQSPNPQVVYVPMYNPAVIYGYPYVTPGYSPAAVATTAVLAFGIGIAVGAMMNSSYGYSYWNCNWHGSTVVYRSNNYYGNSARHGSTASGYGPNGAAHYSNGYNSATGTYARGGTVSNGYGSASAGQAYNPRTGAYGSTVQTSNAYGSSGSSAVSKNGQTAYSQHQTTSQGTTGSIQTSNGAKAVGGTGKYNSAAAGQTANGNKYATATGNTYKNTGSGWQGNSSNTNQKSNSSNYSNQSAKNTSASSGWGQQQKSSGSAFSSGGGGWQSKQASARGSASTGGGGGWGGRR